ncbi:hypothetical protein PPTG_13062 [Phytophthora nicotianae INRA-310]|uniref:Peptidase S1 domain-containing protein n=1 Tax=Phytophthora nicotianae (strain INRA-310) TaxID=761204 RepID=W2Q3J5_PHYN3|nr:hypothetical protein PPTG_13062 [Phytophthora nicotianae INRA-310]ETN07737.1 hypothetical protein PPTG_13062 [Phytophthora nicotianae INRA-310]
MKVVSTAANISMMLGVVAASTDHASRVLVLGGGAVPVGTKKYTTGIRPTIDGDNFCAGSLIAPTKVLTTAACLGISKPANWVSVGTHYINGTQDGEQIRVVAAQNHTDYNDINGSYDVAVLTLEKPSKFTPVKLPAADDSDTVSGMWSKVVGWGYTSFPNGTKSYELQGVSLEVWSNTDCAQIYPLDDTMVCAGGVVGKDSCGGDGGGPLIKERGPGDEDDIVIGLVSWGSDCGVGYPAVYSRVSKAMTWINSVLKG